MNLAKLLIRLHRNVSGATATEYMLILAFVVIPLALLSPMFIKMVQVYSARMSYMQLPFP